MNETRQINMIDGAKSTTKTLDTCTNLIES